MAIRSLVVGLGGRGRDWVRELRSAPEYELAGVVDVDPATASAGIDALGLSRDRCFSSIEHAFARVTCDAVIVATPPTDHRATCEAALSHGCAALVEKPFTLRLRDAIHLVDLAERERRPLMVAQNYRYMRAFRTARRVIADGLLGRLAFIQCQYFRVPHEIPSWLAAGEDSVLWGAGVHHLDALRYIAGEDVTGVLGDRFSAPGAQLPPGGSLRTWLTFASGLRASYTASYESSGHEFFERGQEFYARFVGEKGTLHILHRWLVWCESGKLPRVIRRGRRDHSEERVLLNQLAQALNGGVEPETSGRDNLRTMAILEAYRRSIDTRTWIDPAALLSERVYA